MECDSETTKVDSSIFILNTQINVTFTRNRSFRFVFQRATFSEKHCQIYKNIFNFSCCFFYNI